MLLFHAMVLPLVLWACALWRSRRRLLVTRVVAAYATAGVLVALAVAFGSPQFRCGGRYDMRLPLVSDSPGADCLIRPRPEEKPSEPVQLALPGMDR